MIPSTILANGDYPFTATRGLEHLLAGAGTFDSGTVKLQYRVHNGPWVDVTDAEWTGDFEARFVPPTPEMRLSVSGIVAASEIFLSLTPLV